jgi:hypothetical protein
MGFTPEGQYTSPLIEYVQSFRLAYGCMHAWAGSLLGLYNG